MATLTLENVPDELVARLEEEAKQNRRSLTEETLERLQGSLGHPPENGREKIALLRRLHRELAHLPPLTDEILRSARKHGRP